jgi:hypothetical protein
MEKTMDILNKKTCVVFASILVMSALTNCSFGNNKILESEYAPGLKVTQHEDKLTVSGLCAHSAYVVDAIRESRIGNSINMVVEITSNKKKDASGAFEHEIKLSSEIEEVSFGNKKTTIWRRK